VTGDPSLVFVLAAALLAAASGLPGLFMRRDSPWSQRIATALMALAGALGVWGALRGIFEPASISCELPWRAVGGSLLGLDPLSAFFLVPVFLVGALASIYGLGYWPQARNARTARRLQLFFGLLVAAMALLLVARQALAFLAGWEAMALAAFFLVGLEDERAESRRAGMVFLLAAHASTLVLFGLFLLWRQLTGSFELEAFYGSLGGASVGCLLFLGLVGFGLKAGIMPLHFWLPGAHAAAPSHVSALLSGVVLKMGIYGLLRLAFLLPAAPTAWGGAVLALGSISGLLGVAFALAQHDIKKLLAYHSVENIGIILMGLGVALSGRSTGRPALLALGLAGCLLHVWNHGLFKSLLFLGSGSVVRATGTRAIDRLGGLGRRMPWTAALFLAGAVAICGLPPLNGFVSEFLIYLGLFKGLLAGSSTAALAAPVLAMIGALALACFAKAAGTAFLGEPRSPEAEGARESPVSMLLPMMILGALCAFIGLAPLLLAPVLDSVGSSLGDPLLGSTGVGSLAPLGTLGAASAAALAIAVALALAFSRKIRGARLGPTWDCGYARPEARMQYSSSSFARGMAGMFGWALRLPKEPRKLKGAYPEPARLETEAGDAVLDGALEPAFRGLERLSRFLHRFQQGLAQKYLLYILIALALLAIASLPLDRILGRAAGG
jgi:hydrogenase-4 component B